MPDETPLSRVRAFQRAANPNRDYQWPAEEAANIGGVPLYFDDIEALASTDELDAVEVAIRRLREAERDRNAARAELKQLRARLGEPQRKRSTTVWAIAWDRNGGTTYSFPIENERYARDGFADLVRSGVTGMRLVVSRDGVRWRDASGDAAQPLTTNGA